jgi:hypothetical protein
MNLLYAGALFCFAVVLAGIDVSCKRLGLGGYAVRNDSLTQKLLEP